MITNQLKDKLIEEIETLLTNEDYYLDIGTGLISPTVTDSDLQVPARINRVTTQEKDLYTDTNKLEIEFWIPSTEANDLFNTGYESGGDSDGGFGGGYEEAQSFQVNQDSAVTQTQLYLKGDGNDITVEIQTDADGSPSGTIVTDGSATITGFNNSSYSWKTAEFTEKPGINSNTTYWLVLKSDASTDNAYSVRYDSTGEYAEGNRSHYNGTTWTDEPNHDLHFQVYINRFTENGVFNASSNGDLYTRNTHTQQVKNSDIEYIITYEFEYGVDINE